MVTFLDSLPWLAAVGLLGSLYYLWYRIFSYQGIPKSLAFANSDGSLFSRARSSLGSVFEVNTLLWAGYRDVRIALLINCLISRITADSFHSIQKKDGLISFLIFSRDIMLFCPQSIFNGCSSSLRTSSVSVRAITSFLLRSTHF